MAKHILTVTLECDATTWKAILAAFRAGGPADGPKNDAEAANDGARQVIETWAKRAVPPHMTRADLARANTALATAEEASSAARVASLKAQDDAEALIAAAFE